MKSARTVVLLVTCSILPVPALKAQSPPPGGSSAANPHDAGAKLPAVVLSAFRQAHPTAVITNVSVLVSFGFDIALVALLLHPMSRDYQRIWFK